jgi:hypothetical protein
MCVINLDTPLHGQNQEIILAVDENTGRLVIALFAHFILRNPIVRALTLLAFHHVLKTYVVG